MAARASTPGTPRLSLSLSTYDELKRTARAILRGMGRSNALDATSLAHEAYGRLARRTREQWKSQSHFLAGAAQAMRHILVDRARRRNAQKRGGTRERESISVVDVYRTRTDVDLLAFDELVSQLAAIDPRQGQVIELKFFGGLTNAEIARTLEVSVSTVESEWRHARAWLRAHLADPAD